MISILRNDIFAYVSYLKLAATAQVYLPILFEQNLTSAHAMFKIASNSGMEHESWI